MKCPICKTGETYPGKTMVTLQRGDSVVVIRDVPAEVCKDCGEYYLDETTARRVYDDAEETQLRKVELEIKRSAAKLYRSDSLTATNPPWPVIDIPPCRHSSPLPIAASPRGPRR